MKNWVFIMFAILCARNLPAADATTDFLSANELYAKGKFADATAIYGKILQTDGQSPSLLFNYGNAEFKAGHLGKAIAAYRRAELLAPRDAELRANLAFVRSQVQGATLRENSWQRWVGSLSLNEGAVVTAVLLWLLFLLLAARQIDDAQAGVAEAGRTVKVKPDLVGAAMAQGARHLAQQLGFGGCTLEVHHPANAAHQHCLPVPVDCWRTAGLMPASRGWRPAVSRLGRATEFREQNSGMSAPR